MPRLYDIRKRSVRAAGLELLYIFQHDDPWPHQCRPPKDDPRKAPDIPINQRSPLGRGKMLAVRGEPCQTHRTSTTYRHRVNVPHGSLQMLRVWVVRLVEQDCVRVMVDGDSDRPAGGKLNTRGSTSAPGEVVHDDLVKNIYVNLDE